MLSKSEKSAAAKLIWENCEVIGTHLGLTKHEVHDFLYAEAKTLDLIDPLLNCDPAAIDAIQNTKGWQRLQRVTQVEEKPKNKYKPQINEIVTDPAEMLKLAIWFLTRFETHEKAMSSLQLASKCLKDLS